MFPSQAFSGGLNNSRQWVPMPERVKIWDSIAGKGKYTLESEIQASFYKDGATWMIVGANSPIVNPTVYPKEWPIKGKDFEVYTISNPITNYQILPFSEEIKIANKSDTVFITAAKDSFAPASFIIRSGDNDLDNMNVEVADFKANNNDKNNDVKIGIISKSLIDIRTVKCWYQAGVGKDANQKTLVPELLLHDDDLVRVDYENQVNLINSRIKDSEYLKLFRIPKHQNKQIWLTIHIPEGTPPGTYNGSINIYNNNYKKSIKIKLVVLPFALPEPMLFYGLYYRGILQNSSNPVVGALTKTEEQMKLELIDMKEHGLQNTTIENVIDRDKAKWDKDWDTLDKMLKIRRDIGWGGKPLFFLDRDIAWNGYFDSYEEKILKVKDIAKNNDIKDVYIYGVDERTGETLLNKFDRNLYKQVHNLGARNFVAGIIGQFIKFTRNVDLWIIYGGTNNIYARKNNFSSDEIIEAKKLNKTIYFYGNPFAGFEEPETYRNEEGFKLFLINVDGVLDYAYQDVDSCWNDFTDKINYRPLVMAYPTLKNPIPTVQWEGWREGVNDVRYLTVLHNKGIEIKELKGLITSVNDPDEIRQIIINKIMTKKVKTRRN